MLRRTGALVLFCFLAAGQEPIDTGVNSRIRKEATENSRILATIHYLTDVFGARVTGSPQARAAGEWAMHQLTEWGLADARQEAWDFGRDGWSSDRAAAFLTAPLKDTLVAETWAWTPGTDGPVTAACVQIVPPDNPTQSELSAWLAAQAEGVRGKIVLAGKHAYPLAAPLPAEPGKLTPAQVSEQVDRFLADNGALVRVNDAARPYGIITGLQNRTYDPSRVPPTLVLRNEDFGRISRLLADGFPVEMEVQIVNNIHPEGRTSYNVLAEIPGTDKAGEVVMLGGHLDSWHAATGATDNASGVAVVMEAARILKAIGVEPRRTIRVALWTGEEQGLLGSQAYVREHFGTAESPRPDFARVSAYLNLDAGTGRIYGLSVFGPPAAAAVLGQIVAPFAESGVLGAAASRIRRPGGSDHSSFTSAGLPGISLGQDPLDYFAATWHSNLDTYERIVENDLKQAAIVLASTVYHLAMRDELLPRFGPAELPLAMVVGRPSGRSRASARLTG